MTRVTWMGLFVYAALLAVPAVAADRPPNVVVILTDDQGTLDARCFGSTDLDTPAIDRLAERGVRFTQAYAHTVCCPARAMLMTGRYPQRCNVNTWMQGQMYGPKGVVLDGHSVLPLVKDASAASAYPVIYWQWEDGWMVRQGDWKLIVNGLEGLDRPALDPVYLANLSDPRPEATNHAKDRPDIVERLTQLHEAWSKEVAPKKEK